MNMWFLFRCVVQCLLLSTGALSICAGQSYTDISKSVSSGQNAIKYRIMPQEEDIEGSPFLMDDWLEANIMNKDSVGIKVDKFNYHTYSQALVFKKNNKIYTIPEKESIISFNLDERYFVGAYNASEYQFFEVLISGYLKLVLGKRSFVIRGQPSKGYITGTKDRYEEIVSYYLMKDSTRKVEQVKNRRKVLDYIGDQDGTLKKFMKEQNIKTNSAEDLIKLVRYYNSLIEKD